MDDDATTPPDDATARRVVEVEADNAALRRELQTVHAALRYERAQAELLAKAHEQLTRALPAPAAVALPANTTTPPRRPWPWPWRR